MDRVGEYLQSLPNGVRSVPEAQVRREIIDDQLEWLASLGRQIDPRLEPHVHEAVGAWASEVLANALVMHARGAYADEAEFFAAIYERQRALFRTPFYRAVMMLMSPTLVMMGADRRWATYRRGSQLLMGRWRRDGDRRAAQATLTFPPGLHPEPILLGFGEMFRAAIDGAGARQSEVSLREHDAGQACWELRYVG